MSRNPSRSRRLAVAVAFAGLISVLLPSAPAQATENIHLSMVLHDTFDRLNTVRWGRYTGQPGGDPYGLWSASHVTVGSGTVKLRGYRQNGRFVTAGMMLTSSKQTYGKYLVRAHFDISAGVEHAMLLWPVAGWPPEVDFSEGPYGLRDMATSHWSSSNQQIHRFLSVDMRQWHTYGIVWTPTRLVYTIDGQPWTSMVGAAVPHVPMQLAIQTAATTAQGEATNHEVTMTISDVYVWRYVP